MSCKHGLGAGCSECAMEDITGPLSPRPPEAEALKRIDKRLGTWSLNKDSARVTVNLGDLRKLREMAHVPARPPEAEEVERVALDIAVADAEQTRWGRKIMPLEIARVFARAAIAAMRPSDEVASLRAEVERLKEERQTIFEEAIEWRDRFQAAEARLAERENNDPIALRIGRAVMDELTTDLANAPEEDMALCFGHAALEAWLKKPAPPTQEPDHGQ